MNIFALDQNPGRAARMHCDRHVVKMALEAAQLLSTALHLRDTQAALSLTKQGLCYRPTHRKHPCTLWAIHSRGNLAWLERLALALCQEYTYRYGKEHASEKVIRALMDTSHCETESARLWHRRRRTPFAQAMPEPYRGADPVAAYRRYYIAEKSPICKWTRRHPPQWFTQTGEQLRGPVPGRSGELAQQVLLRYTLAR